MLKLTILISVLIKLTVLNQPAFAENNQDFNNWLAVFKAEALAANISEKTIEDTFKNASLLPRVIVLDRGQPEFISPFLVYLDKRVTPNQVAIGRAKLEKHQLLFESIESKYGVPKNILIAFWGLETNYGVNKGHFDVASSLMTLAYEGRRATFFRNQLLDAMRVIDAGHNSAADMRGSWAGAMGHLQFMPSTLLKYGVDADDDGRIDIWTSKSDAFASAANYLSRVGWRYNEPIATEVKLPDNFDYALARLNTRKSTLEWINLGVKDIRSKVIPTLENTAIVMPQGWQGPAFMIFSNFDVVMDWNRSVNYALSVAYLANQLDKDNPIIARENAQTQALSFNQMWALQGRLNELGYDCGPPDGFPGLKTQTAVGQYQASQFLPQDGYASFSLYQQLLLLTN